MSIIPFKHCDPGAFFDSEESHTEQM